MLQAPSRQLVLHILRQSRGHHLAVRGGTEHRRFRQLPSQSILSLGIFQNPVGRRIRSQRRQHGLGQGGVSTTVGVAIAGGINRQVLLGPRPIRISHHLQGIERHKVAISESHHRGVFPRGIQLYPSGLGFNRGLVRVSLEFTDHRGLGRAGLYLYLRGLLDRRIGRIGIHPTHKGLAEFTGGRGGNQVFLVIVGHRGGTRSRSHPQCTAINHRHHLVGIRR